MSELPLSGERVIEDDYRSSPGMYAIYLMHLASYEFAKQYTAGQRVLDLGCGSGDGAAMIAETARSVTAVDVSPEAVSYAAHKYGRPNLTFQQIKADELLPFPDQSFDVVLSFQVIEHVMDDAAYVREACRVLTEDGVLIVITPNRTTRLLAGQKPWNRWHVREYGSEELLRLLHQNGGDAAMQYMTARGEIARLELGRYARMKWITLPVTLSWLPESWRRAGLDLLHAIAGLRTRSVQADRSFDFSLSDVAIGGKSEDALNLVAVVRPTRERT